MRPIGRHSRTALGAVPLARYTLMVQLVTIVIVGGYLLVHYGIGFFGVSQTATVRIILPDAAGLDPANRPMVTIAGVYAGRVTSVRYDQSIGKTVASASIDPAMRSKLHSDATVHIYPRSALEDLVLDIYPGAPTAPRLPADATIAATATSAPVGYDKVTGEFDDTSIAYAQILIGTLRQLLRDRPGPLRQAIDRLPNVVQASTVVARELATRRSLLSRLVSELATITATTSARGRELEQLIQAGRETLTATSARQASIEQAMAPLAAVLSQSQTTFAAVTGLAGPLGPALQALQPTARALPGALRATRRFLPSAQGLISDLRPLVRQLGSVTALRSVLRRLQPTAAGLLPVAADAHTAAKTVAENTSTLPLFGNDWSGAISGEDAHGAITRGLFFGLELDPFLFGLPGSAPNEQPALRRDVITLLERTCIRVNSVACYALTALASH